jgi:hypothetical protein
MYTANQKAIMKVYDPRLQNQNETAQPVESDALPF